LVFDGGVFPDYLVGKGIVQQSQIEAATTAPARFVAEDGKIAQQGFASAEPYIYENEVPEWGKPVAFELIHDTGPRDLLADDVHPSREWHQVRGLLLEADPDHAAG
jgi:hypothetical protein